MQFANEEKELAHKINKKDKYILILDDCPYNIHFL